MVKALSSKLNIYLIKEEFEMAKDIIKSDSQLIKIELLKSKKYIFYKSSKQKKPPYIGSFFLNNPEISNLYSSSAQVLYLIKIDINQNKQRFFAIPFGVGFHFLNQGVIEERFGLRIVLNNVEEDMLRSIDKRNLSTIPKLGREQIGSNSGISEFGIDIEQDLILGVTGKTKNSNFGNIISGKDAFSITAKQNMDTVNGFLINCYTEYKKKSYKSMFGWIDQIKEVKSKHDIADLFTKLIGRIQKHDLGKIWMAIPEIIDWSDTDGFNYSPNRSGNLHDDISVIDFLVELYPDDNYSELNFEVLKKHKIIRYSSTNQSILDEWSILNCLYCEENISQATYILSNGKWYNINPSFVDEVDNEYKTIIKANNLVDLPICINPNENEYNKYVAENSKGYFALMDRKIISFGGGYSKIEFCDLFSTENEIIHIKNYGASSVLSHLFNQGLVSGELLRTDLKFVNLVNNELPESHKIPAAVKINPNEYKIIFGVISHHEKILDIPFFSKVSLRNVRKRLESLGYTVSLQKIDFDGSKLPVKQRKLNRKKRKKNKA